MAGDLGGAEFRYLAECGTPGRADLLLATALYETSGWIRAGTVTIPFGDGPSLNEYVYLGPAKPR